MANSLAEILISSGVFSEMRRILKTSDDKKEKSKEFYDYMKLAYLHIKSVLVSFGTKEELFMRLREYVSALCQTHKLLSKVLVFHEEKPITLQYLLCDELVVLP